MTQPLAAAHGSTELHGLVISLCLMLMVSVGLAQSTEPPTTTVAGAQQARDLYRLGAKLYESGRYAEALTAFREAYDLVGRKAILYNMANTQERLGDLKGAIESLQRYLPFAPPTRVAAIELRIGALQERLDAAAAAAAAARPPPPTEPTPFVPPMQTKVRPRWELVAIGGSLAAGFGTVAAFSYFEGIENRDLPDPDAYRRNLVLNNVALSVAGVGGGLAVIGLAVPRKYEVLISATPTGAIMNLRF